MAEITFITGGARSGKSKFAQTLAEQFSANPIYLATARIWDDDFKQRVERHKTDRNENWQTVEIEKEISNNQFEGKTVLLDCITLCLNNYFFDNQFDIEISLSEAKQEWETFIQKDFKLIVVSNELGMGVHPENEISRKFADMQGWMNQHIASQANDVYLMISGIPLKIK